MFDNDEMYTSGAFVDPGVIMGPRAGAFSRSAAALDSSSDTLALPIAGAEGSPRVRPTLGHFVASPAGWLIILLALGYVVFVHVFSDVSDT